MSQGGCGNLRFRKEREGWAALYVKEKLHRKKYFASLLEELEQVPESVIDLLA